jgi:UDPglucose 6-dehydrogenase
MKMKIAVIGSGFVGQATGKGFKKHGNEVTFIDVDPAKIAELDREGFHAYLASEYTEITTDITMFSVPTPTNGGAIQLDILKQAVTDFANRLKTHDKYHVVVVRSTVPPGTTRNLVVKLIEKISGKKAGEDFGVCMQPEYLREKTAEADFERPWFILIGQYDEKSGDVLEKLYRSFDAPIERCGLEEAEFQKYVNNVFNAVKIAFFNELRIVAEHNKWDVDKIFHATAESAEGMWNPVYGIRAHGPFDGACLPKDTRALLQWGEKQGFNMNILRTVISENLKHEKIMGKNKTVRVNYLEKISV